MLTMLSRIPGVCWERGGGGFSPAFPAAEISLQ